MAYEFSEETKAEDKYFSEGIHKVTIESIDHDETDQGKEFFEFTVKGENGEKASARIWFTTDKAAKYSFDIVRTLLVHNAKSDVLKEKVRNNVNSCKNTNELAELALSLEGGEAWYTLYKSDRTYEYNGEIKHSYDKNIYGYEPNPREKTSAEMVADFMNSPDEKVSFK